VAEEDYQYYLKKLQDACKKYECKVHTYVLMSNPVHVLITPQAEDGISKGMDEKSQQFLDEGDFLCFLLHGYRDSINMLR